MDVLHGEGVRLVLYLQNVFSGLTNEMLFLSRVGDPRNSFLIYFPVSYHLDRAVGLMVLWVAVMSEWLNLILKWFLRGERPYWWVNESEVWKDVKLSQYPLTCETGPGSPSGHAMVTTSVLFTMMSLITKQMLQLLKIDKSSFQRRILQIFLWFDFFVIIALVCLSRIFIATHFPHQVIGGVLGGIVISYLTQNNLDQSKFVGVVKCSIVSLMLIVSSLGFYQILSYAIFDPSESVQKALKWCANPAYIHIETRPFYALVRDAGAVCGIGLAHYLVNLFKTNVSVITHNDSPNAFPNSPKNNLFKILETVLSITAIQLLETLQLFSNNEILSYIIGYFKSAFLVIIVVFVTPSIVAFIKGRDKSTKMN